MLPHGSLSGDERCERINHRGTETQRTARGLPKDVVCFLILPILLCASVSLWWKVFHNSSRFHGQRANKRKNSKRSSPKNVTALGQPFAGHFVPFRWHHVNAGGVHPAIVKVKKRADRDGVVERFVRPAGLPYVI